jgi:hypothetical protein
MPRNWCSTSSNLGPENYEPNRNTFRTRLCLSGEASRYCRIPMRNLNRRFKSGDFVEKKLVYHHSLRRLHLLQSENIMSYERFIRFGLRSVWNGNGPENICTHQRVGKGQIHFRSENRSFDSLHRDLLLGLGLIFHKTSSTRKYWQGKCG